MRKLRHFLLSTGQASFILLTMSLLSILFGCKQPKSPEKQQEEWPRFPATDNTGVQIAPVVLDDGFVVNSYYITQNKQSIYVLGYRNTDPPEVRSEPRNRSEVRYMDYRLYCLNSKGEIEYHKDMLRTKWQYGGTFGLLEGQLLLRIGDWFLVLNPENFATLEKIPVHSSEYISWENETMTRDEFEDDYQQKFDKLYQNSAAKWLDWSPASEYLVFVQGTKGKRSAWSPMSYEDELLAGLQKHFEPILVLRNPNTNALQKDAHLEISDGPSNIKEAEFLSAGTEFNYPNYHERSTVQYEMTLGNQTLHFSTSNKKAHQLRLGFSDNLFLTTQDGAVWVDYEDVLYRIVSL